MIEPFDDPNIKPHDMLIRGIQCNQIATDSNGNRRISRMAFEQSSDENGGMSVEIESLIKQDGKNPQNHIKTYKKFLGAVYLNVEEVRNAEFEVGDRKNRKVIGFQVGRTPNSNSQYHGDVWGKGQINYGKPGMKKLRSICEWCVPIPGVTILPTADTNK